MKSKLLFALVCIALFSIINTGCSLFDASESGELIVDIEAPSTLLLHNTTKRTVIYFVGDEDVMARMDNRPDRSSWPTIGAGQTAEVPFEEITFYSKDTQRLYINWFQGTEGNIIRLTIDTPASSEENR